MWEILNRPVHEILVRILSESQIKHACWLDNFWSGPVSTSIKCVYNRRRLCSTGSSGRRLLANAVKYMYQNLICWLK